MVKAVGKISKAMFPIFKQIIDGQQITIGVAGTGYFINQQGIFVTTAHIFDENNSLINYGYYGMLPDSLHDQFLEIQEIVRDDENDIFIGKVKNINKTQYISFSSNNPEIGMTICISGYPLAQIVNNEHGGIEFGGVRRYFQPSFILDIANSKVSSPSGLVRNHKGFLLRDFGLYGMSGGPVVDVDGMIVGMQGSVTSPRISTNGIDSISVQNALAIDGQLIKQLLMNNKIDFN